MSNISNAIDWLSDWLGRVAAWLYFLIGLIIAWEVGTRYLFNAPPIWTQEIAQLLMLRATFLAIARALQYNQHIRLNVLDIWLRPAMRIWFQLFPLVFIALFSLLVTWYDYEIFLDSFVRGRTTGTMLNIHSWWSQLVIPVGFALLFLQALVQICKLFRRAEKS